MRSPSTTATPRTPLPPPRATRSLSIDVPDDSSSDVSIYRTTPRLSARARGGHDNSIAEQQQNQQQHQWWPVGGALPLLCSIVDGHLDLEVDAGPARAFTVVPHAAFGRCNALVSVRLPSSVTRIGPRAFARCPHLTTVILPPSLRHIDYEAFRGCALLSDCELPDALQSVGPHAFACCTRLPTAAIAATTIGASAFAQCASLTSLRLGVGVEHIGPLAFVNCTALCHVHVHPQSSLAVVGTGAFRGCAQLASLPLPPIVHVGAGALPRHTVRTWHLLVPDLPARPPALASSSVARLDEAKPLMEAWIEATSTGVAAAGQAELDTMLDTEAQAAACMAACDHAPARGPSPRDAPSASDGRTPADASCGRVQACERRVRALSLARQLPRAWASSPPRAAAWEDDEGSS